MNVKLIWATPNAEQLVSDMARVSNPKHQGMPPGKLLAYCVRNSHWSIFEMVDACFEITTTRDIARQILRHRSFVFQEFSQRYAEVSELPEAPLREARLQDTENRQNSLETDDDELQRRWRWMQQSLLDDAMTTYQEALDMGIAKEVARAVLPEGLTTSRMYMKGSLRSWMHYCSLRTGNGTQKEHQEIAKAIQQELKVIFPMSFSHIQ